MKKPIVSFLDFQKLDLRVGEVKEVYFIKNSRNLIGMKVDLGQDYGEVEIMAGLAQYFKPEDLQGKKFIFVANLEPKKMLDSYSNGMILVADDSLNPKLIPVDTSVKNGTVIR